MDHPRKGPTQLFRRDLSTTEQERVLDNPRAHTGKGYYTKSDNSYRGSGNSNSSSYHGSYHNERKEAYYGRKSYSRKYNSRSSRSNYDDY